MDNQYAEDESFTWDDRDVPGTTPQAPPFVPHWVDKSDIR
jgi:hypothetical protein